MVVFIFGRKGVPVGTFESCMPKTCFGQGNPELGPGPAIIVYSILVIDKYLPFELDLLAQFLRWT